MEKTRAAGTRQTERLASGKSSAEIVRSARQEIASTWRVYVKEPLFTFSGTLAECETHFQAKYEGRVEDADWWIDHDKESDRHRVILRLWNVKSEWKSEDDARAYGDLLANYDVEVVARNSKREHQLKGYGTLKLASR